MGTTFCNNEDLANTQLPSSIRRCLECILDSDTALTGRALSPDVDAALRSSIGTGSLHKTFWIGAAMNYQRMRRIQYPLTLSAITEALIALARYDDRASKRTDPLEEVDGIAASRYR